MRKTFTQYGVGGTRVTFELECEQVAPNSFEGSIVKVRIDRQALIGPACALCNAGKAGMLHEHSAECQAQYLRDTGPADAGEPRAKHAALPLDNPTNRAAGCGRAPDRAASARKDE